MKYEGIRVLMPDTADWCSDNVSVQLIANDSSVFSGNSQTLQKLLGGIRAALSFECSGVKRIELAGNVGAVEAYRGYASAAEGWRLNGQYLLSSSLPGNAPTPSAAPTVKPQPVAPPVAPAPVVVPKPAIQPPPPVVQKQERPITQSAHPQTQSPAIQPPPASTPATSEQQSGGSSGLWIGVLVLVAGAGIVVWWLMRHKPRLASDDKPLADDIAAPRDKECVSEEADVEAEDVWESIEASMEPVDLKLPAAERGDLLAVQKAKYQARITEAMDRIAKLKIEYQAFAGKEKSLQKSLQKFGEDLHAATRKSLAARFGSTRKSIFRALALVPMWRYFKRLPAAFKFILIGCGVWLVYSMLNSYGSFAYYATPVSAYWNYLWLQYGIRILTVYIIVVPILFFLERRRSVVHAYKGLKNHLGGLRKLELSYVYRGQGQQDESYSALGISTYADKNTQPSERTIGVDADQEGMALAGRMLLRLMDKDGEVLTYRLSGNNKPGGLLRWNGKNQFMTDYGQVLIDTLDTLEERLGEEARDLGAMAEVRWRINVLQHDIPRIEALIENIHVLENIWRAISIDDSTFDFLLKRIDLFNMADKAVPAGILLYGYPGNGKRYLARMITKSVCADLVELHASDLTDANAVKQIWSQYRNKPGTVLFIDQADHVLPKAGSEHAGGESREVTMAWCEEWDRIKTAQARVWVVMAATDEKAVNPLILSRFGSSKVEIKVPNETGRRLVLQQACREHEIQTPIPESVIHTTNGATIQELRDIVAEVRLQSYPDLPNETHWKNAIVSIRGGDAAIRDETKTWERLILPAEIKNQLKTITNILVQAERFKEKGIEAPKGLLLYGPPGTGKTEIARTLANESGLQFIATSTAEMKGQYIGQSGHMVREVFARARANAPCILFIDEIESLAASRSGGDADRFTKDIVTQMLQEMDGVQKSERHVFVLAATNIPDSIDSAILSRFRNKIEIPLPDVEGRREILRCMLKSRIAEPSFDIDEAAIKLAKVLKNKSGRDLKNFVDRALEREVMRAGSPDNLNLSIESLMEEAMSMQGDNAFKDASKTWDRLVLPTEIKEQLKNITRILIDAEKFKEKGVEAPKGMLLFGPPGTGKTEIARTLANESGLEFLSASTADMKAGYVGQSGQQVKQVFANARVNAPCILFIDEIESIAAKRGSSRADQFTQEIVTQMLQEMDGMQKKGGKDAHVFVLAATNSPEAIDNAILSRFTARVEIPLPDEAGRREILKGILSSRIPNAGFDIDEGAARLARVLKGKSGRDLKNFINRALEREALRAGSPDEINLTLETLLEEASPTGKEVSDEQLAKIWSTIVLPDPVKDSILNKIRMFNRADPAAPRGLLLFGPPGTGKTEIARKIADSASCHFMSLSIPDLKAGYVGGSGERVRKIWEEARSRGRAVIFVDECEGMFARRGSTNSDAASDELVQAFLAEWDGVGSSGQVWVVGATNRRDLLDDAIESRFGAAVEISLPDAASRQRILELELEKLGREIKVPARIGKATNGFSGRNLATLARDVCTLAAEKGEVTEADWNALLGQQSSAGSDRVDDDARWDSLVIDADTLDKLKTVCGMLQHIETLREQGIKPPRGMLLYGAPGTGKTQIARTLANESGVQFISATTADLKAGYVGQSGQRVKEVFERARSRAPSILFIDEMESVAPSRNGPGADQFTREIVTQMLQELEGVKASDAHVFLLAATNLPDAIDSAILSRLPEKLEIPLPGLAEREKLFSLFLSKIKNIDLDMVTVVRSLAERYTGVSGRDIRNIVDTAQQSAVRRALSEGMPDRIAVTVGDLGISDAVRDPV